MIGKLPVLGFSLVTAISSQALAHESHDSRQHRPSSYAPATTQVDLRGADLNRDGRVTMQEALDSGRQVFRRHDRDNNHMLTRREVSGPSFRQDDRNNDGRVSMREYQRTVRAQFASLDSNRDGYLARYELGYRRPGMSRPAGWRR
jgi:Ca2+-binding EF-hand superfamily protein